MPFTTDGKIKTKLYVYMEPIKAPEEDPYYYFSEYTREDMVLVHTYELEFTPNEDPSFTIPASVEKLRAQAAEFIELAKKRMDMVDNLQALPAPCDHNWLTLPNGADECTHCGVTATQADVPLR